MCGRWPDVVHVAVGSDSAALSGVESISNTPFLNLWPPFELSILSTSSVDATDNYKVLEGRVRIIFE